MKLKFLLILISGIIAFSGSLKAQESSGNDSTASKSGTEKFIDKDNDGIDDRLSRSDSCVSDYGRRHKHHKRAHRRDRFIDEDGDGINDHRCRGMGLCKGRGKGKRAKSQQNSEKNSENK